MKMYIDRGNNRMFDTFEYLIFLKEKKKRERIYILYFFFSLFLHTKRVLWSKHEILMRLPLRITYDTILQFLLFRNNNNNTYVWRILFFNLRLYK